MKKVIVIVLIVGIGLAVFMLRGKNDNGIDHKEMVKDKAEATNESEILYYTCGMHPSVKVTVQEYGKGSKSCPICNMFLTPVYKKTKKADESKDIVSIDLRGLSLAGIETYKLKIIPLAKEIETVGIVAYDPALRIAEEEYLQALKAYNNISKSNFKGAKSRAREITEAAKVKLEVLGLNEKLIKDLEKKGVADKSLILPSETMWVYAHIYEHELSWPSVGDKAKMVSESNPEVIISGEIKSIEPIIQEQTRTLRLKILADNSDFILKPNMYVDVNFNIELGEALALPREAVLDTGKRKVIYVDLGKGDFQLREVVLGPLVQGSVGGSKIDFYPLIEGAKIGEEVVSKGNFLIDSQSQLGAASSVYGGALGDEGTNSMPAGHQH